MITRLEIKNFQSHEENILEFHPGVNIIVGASDSGKTAIIRAMRWCVWNRPSGSDICSSWGGVTSVRLDTDEGNFVVRSKDKTDKYTSHVSGKKDIKHKAFGTSVPEEVGNILNFSEVNLQMQLDSPFLLSESAGEVARHFNKVAKLDKIDLSTSNINSWIRELLSDIKLREMDLSVFEVELKKFEYLEKLEAEVEVLEDQEKRLSQLRTARQKLYNILSTYEDVTKDIEVESKLLPLEKPLNNILNDIDERLFEFTKKGKLLTLMDDITDVGALINEQTQIITVEKDVLDLLRFYSDKKTAVEQRTSLFKLLSNVTGTNTRIKTAETNYNTLHAKFEREFPNTCPLCGKPK